MLTKLTIIVESSRPVLPDLNQARIRLSCVTRTLQSDGTLGDGDCVRAVSAIPMDREIIEHFSVPPCLCSEWQNIRGRINYLEATCDFGKYNVLVKVDHRKKQVVYEPERFAGNVPCVLLVSQADGHEKLTSCYVGVGTVQIVDAIKYEVITKLKDRAKGRPKTKSL